MAVTGFITTKNGKYYAVLNLKEETGKRKQKWFSTNLPLRGNKRSAEKFLQKLIDEWEAKSTPFCRLTFADYLEQWIEGAGVNIKPNTYRTYRAMVVNHIVPYFKQHPVLLQELKPTDLDAYYQSKQQPGSKQNGKGTLSAMSIRHHHQVISKALSDAVHDGLIQFNPASAARKPKTERYNASFLNPSEIDMMLALFIGNVVELPVNLCAVYGFRRSEVLGLKWEHIDFENRTITVTETLQQGVDGDYVDTPKTNSSYRTLPMTDSVYKLLKGQKHRQERLQGALGAGYIQNDYVCTWPDGNVISPNYLTRTFHNVIAKSSLPNIRLHDLRHSAASNLLNMGFSIVQVQQWLGHGSASTTLNFYAHVDKNSKLDMAAAMERAIYQPTVQEG
ncbi:site-specific integrase [Acutalibacter sp. JLR.KK004]|uniref:tyrosine-type recombinase/integrase n=1 Tax=Acutalibacter sp. JLR.KK004 TaxID=3112622 RepID=UPI002FF17808